MTHDAYLDPYRQSLARHGPEFEATLWISEKSQRLRFEVFTQMCFLPGKRILDAGCSRGDLAQYLITQKIEFDQYVGVDALPQVIDHARRRNLPRCTFEVGDFVHDPKKLAIGRPQVICISGSLNTMADQEIFTVLDAAWAATKETLLFNFLPRWPQEQVQDIGPARRLDSPRILEWVNGQTTQFAYRQDYFPRGHDATVCMSKPR